MAMRSGCCAGVFQTLGHFRPSRKTHVRSDDQTGHGQRSLRALGDLGSLLFLFRQQGLLLDVLLLLFFLSHGVVLVSCGAV